MYDARWIESVKRCAPSFSTDRNWSALAKGIHALSIAVVSSFLLKLISGDTTALSPVPGSIEPCRC